MLGGVVKWIDLVIFFFQAEDGIRDRNVTGVQTCALPISLLADHEKPDRERDRFYLVWIFRGRRVGHSSINQIVLGDEAFIHLHLWNSQLRGEIGRASCRERV